MIWIHPGGHYYVTQSIDTREALRCRRGTKLSSLLDQIVSLFEQMKPTGKKMETDERRRIQGFAAALNGNAGKGGFTKTDETNQGRRDGVCNQL